MAASAVDPGFWRQQGAADSDVTVSATFLQSLAKELPCSVDTGRSWQLQAARTVITEDVEGFDCRVGDRARKRRREATITPEAKQRVAEVATDTEPDVIQPAPEAKSKFTGAGAQAGPSSSQGEKRRISKAERDSPSNLPPGRSKPVAKTPQGQTLPRTAAKTPISDGPSIERVQSPPSLPPGWRLEIRHRALSHSRAKDKYYFSPGGTKFTSMVRVQEYCKQLGIPLPSDKEAAAAVKPEKPCSLKSLVHSLAEAARHGSLPEGRLHRYAALRVRDQLRTVGSGTADLRGL